MRQLYFFLIVVLCALSTRAEIAIPKGMAQSDRLLLLEVMGFGAASKILGDPYPLGGYSGVEFGISSEVISTSEISRLGQKTTQQSETNLIVLSFGKGLYNNFDVFLQFAPPVQTEQVSNFGGQFRWGFFQAEYMPLHGSLVIHGNSTNFSNLVVTNTQGFDFVAAFNVEDVSLYLGLGMVKAQGRFIGGPAGVTDTQETIWEASSNSHYVVGMNLKFDRTFLALQIDRYTQPTYAAKLGFRF